MKYQIKDNEENNQIYIVAIIITHFLYKLSLIRDDALLIKLKDKNYE